MTFNEQLRWLITMARTPGLDLYAWGRAKELAACESGLWPDIHTRLKEAMQEQRNDDPRA